MTKKPQLSDQQLKLLTTASTHSSGSLLPLPKDQAPPKHLSKSIKALITRGLLSEQATADEASAWRSEGDRHFAAVLTENGRAAIGTKAAADPQLSENPAGAPKPASKASMVLELLRRKGGATLNELVEATGWLPHTTRAALTGLRKKGHSIAKEKRGDATCYRIAEAG